MVVLVTHLSGRSGTVHATEPVETVAVAGDAQLSARKAARKHD